MINKNIENLKDFESLFYKKMRGLSKDNNAINERIRKLYELIILKGINWNTSYATDNFIIFKNYVEHHMGLQKHMDYLD